jgi:hypothetical protein
MVNGTELSKLVVWSRVQCKRAKFVGWQHGTGLTIIQKKVIGSLKRYAASSDHWSALNLQNPLVELDTNGYVPLFTSG